MNSKTETMKNESKRTLMPELRFPEFRDSSEWRETPLGEISDRIIEKVGDAALTPVSITAGKGFVSQVEKFGRDISGAQYKNYIRLRQGDFAYNKGNSISYPQGCVSRLKEFSQAAAPSAFVSFRLHEGYVPEFFEGLFEKNAHGRQLIKFITSSARSDGLLNISPDEFLSICLPLPPTKAEQKKIAGCLGSLDGLIMAEGRKLTALRDHKRGLMQQLFPQPGQTQPRLRFPEFRDEGEWENKQLGTICKFVRGPFGGALKKEIFVSDGFAVYEQSHAIHGRLDTFRYFIDEEKYRELGRFAVKANDIIMSCSGTMGRFTLIPHEPIPGVINQALLKLTVGTSFNASFILRALELPSNLSKLLIQSAGGAIKNVVGVKNLKAVEIPIPRLAEQQRIADCLAALDPMIAAQEAKIESLKQHKRGLMQQLFPVQEGQ